jgi:hypothetical protein
MIELRLAAISLSERAELGDRGVYANAVTPGGVDHV